MQVITRLSSAGGVKDHAMNPNKERSFDQQFVTRTSDAPREALDVMVARLRSRGRLSWKGKKITREAYISALWLWAEELGADAIERGLAPHLKSLESAVVQGGQVPEASDDDIPVVGTPIVPTEKVRKTPMKGRGK